MAWSFTAGRGGGNTKGSGTTVSVSPTGIIVVGAILVATCTSDNVSTADGNTADHSISDSQGNSWEKIFEYTNTVGGVAQDGVTVSQFICHVTTQLATTDSVTLTIGSATNAKSISLGEFAVGAGMTYSLGTPTAGTADASTTSPSLSLSGLANAEHLFLAAMGSEGPTTDTYTRDAGFVGGSNRGTSGGTADANVWNHMDYDIATATGVTNQNSLNNARDWAAFLTAVDEVSNSTTFSQEIDVNAGSSIGVVRLGELVKSVNQGHSISPIKAVTKSPLSVNLSAAASIVKQGVKSLLVSAGNSVSLDSLKVRPIEIAVNQGVTVTRQLTAKLLKAVTGSNTSSLSKAITKSPASVSVGVTPAIAKRATKTFSVSSAASVTRQLTVKLLKSISQGSTPSVTQGGPIEWTVEIDVNLDFDANQITQYFRRVDMQMVATITPSLSITKAIAKALAFTGSSLLTLLRGIYYPSPDPQNYVHIDTSMNNVRVDLGANTITITEEG